MWPENEPALRIFARIGTRWQYASGGMGAMVIGVRWEAIYPLMDRLGLPPDEWDDLLHQLETMEHAALPVIRGAMQSNNKSPPPGGVHIHRPAASGPFAL